MKHPFIKKEDIEEIGFNVLVLIFMFSYIGLLIYVKESNSEQLRRNATWRGDKPDTLYVQDKQIASEIKEVRYGGATDVHHELLLRNTHGETFVLPSRDFRSYYGVDPQNIMKKSDIRFARPGDTLVIDKKHMDNGRSKPVSKTIIRNVSMQRRGKQR